MNCRLCGTPGCRSFFADAAREYYHCSTCDLMFVPEYGFVSVEAERARYALHDNSSTHDGYHAFLSEVAGVVARHTVAGGRVLDFGSGEQCVLTSILRENGFACTAYDPLYGIGLDALQDRYETVVLCEVIEHVRDVPGVLSVITRSLSPAGVAIIRTRVHPTHDAFASWWYKNDPTHVNFFGVRTFEWIAGTYGYELLHRSGDYLAVLRRSGNPRGLQPIQDGSDSLPKLDV